MTKPGALPYGYCCRDNKSRFALNRKETMTRILKTLSLALVAVAAMSAVMAAGASAGEPLPGVGLTAFNTSTKTHESVNLNVTRNVATKFRVTPTSSELTCESEKYTGASSGTEETPKVKPEYPKGECHAIIGGSKVAAEIDTNGCEYQFHVDKEVTKDEFTGHASLKNCAEQADGSRSLTITLPATGCIVHLDESLNQTINGVTYRNITTASPTHVEIAVAANNIHTTVTGGLLSCGVASGTHAEGTFNGNYTVKGTNTVNTPIDLTVNKLAT